MALNSAAARTSRSTPVTHPAGRLLLFAACALQPALTGCQMCTTSIEPGVEVEVRDRVTQDFIASTPRGVAREGAFQDSLQVSGFSTDAPPRVRTLMGAQERPGRYVVQIEADGYLPWDTAGVRVEEGDCGVRTARFTAALERLIH